ncbi:MAG: hypothetical protein KDA66_12260, partial [Planctomycetaceae bacterium]|nr:hypothetical protein [Planctomycetaceae bacterium]
TSSVNDEYIYAALTSDDATTSFGGFGRGRLNPHRDWEGAAIGDFNGDGLDDYVSVDVAGAHAWVSMSSTLPAVYSFGFHSDFGLITGTEGLTGPLNLSSGFLN